MDVNQLTKHLTDVQRQISALQEVYKHGEAMLKALQLAEKLVPPKMPVMPVIPDNSTLQKVLTWQDRIKRVLETEKKALTATQIYAKTLAMFPETKNLSAKKSVTLTCSKMLRDKQIKAKRDGAKNVYYL